MTRWLALILVGRSHFELRPGSSAGDHGAGEHSPGFGWAACGTSRWTYINHQTSLNASQAKRTQWQGAQRGRRAESGWRPTGWKRLGHRRRFLQFTCNAGIPCSHEGLNLPSSWSTSTPSGGTAALPALRFSEDDWRAQGTLRQRNARPSAFKDDWILKRKSDRRQWRVGPG